MKNLLLVGIFLTAAAHSAPVKVCNTVMEGVNGPKIPTLIEINTDENNVTTAKVTQQFNGQTVVSDETVQISDFRVRAKLTADSDPQRFNPAETLVVRAMKVEADETFNGRFKSGVKLENVRFARLFMIGENPGAGTTTIVEARDAGAKPMGSFLGGILVFPCR